MRSSSYSILEGAHHFPPAGFMALVVSALVKISPFGQRLQRLIIALVKINAKAIKWLAIALVVLDI